MRSRAGALALALLSTAATGCGSCGASGGDTAPRDTLDAGAAASPAAPTERVAVDLIEALPRCDVDHRGVLLDAGTAALVGRYGYALGTPAGVVQAEHDGSTWAQVFDRTVSFAFTLSEPTPIFVSARALGVDARSAFVTLDDQPLGTITFGRDQIRIAETPTTTLPVDAGSHTISLRFAGRSRNDHTPFAELDWVRIGVPDEDPTTYGAPTLNDIVAPTAALGGVPHHALSLRSPSSVRCGLRVPRSSRLRLSVGLDGGDEADVEIRILRDQKEPVLLQATHVVGGARAAWTDLDLSLDSFAGSLVTLELRAITGLRSGRVLFGDPQVVLAPSAPTPVPKARAVVVVALDGVEMSELPPWSGKPDSALPTLSNLALTATTFDRLRAPTSFVSGVVASMLTGLPPRAHSLTDPGARLPASVTTIATVARDAGIHAAMFTGVPTTFGAFGFASSWERFVEHPPQSGAPATAPLDDAAAWVQAVLRDSPDARLLAFVHARGAHPPWDVTTKELEAVPPPDYGGAIEPRRGAQVLARGRERGIAKSFSEQDITRTRALAAIALAGQDRALGAVIEALTSAGLWDETLLIVTGDVSSGASPGALFGDALELREPVLALPLYVHFPGDAFGARRVEAPAEVYDIARTSLLALGLGVGKRTLGDDLAAIASGLDVGNDAPQVATMDDRYSARWGHLVLTGRIGRAPSLCDLALDPTCAFDRRLAMPLATQWTFRGLVAGDLETLAPLDRRESVTIGADTEASLRVWGAIPP